MKAGGLEISARSSFRKRVLADSFLAQFDDALGILQKDASHDTNFDLIIGLRVFCCCGWAQKTSLRFLSTSYWGKTGYPGRSRYGLIRCADHYRQNVQGSSTARQTNRPLERDVDSLAWSKKQRFSCVGTVRPASISEIFGNLMVDTNNVFGFNCKGKLHENDVNQSFFHFFYDAIISKDKIREFIF
jgi:hypothetical protein